MNTLLKSSYFACVATLLLSGCIYQQNPSKTPQKPAPVQAMDTKQASSEALPMPQPAKKEQAPTPSATQLQGSPAQTIAQNTAPQTPPIHLNKPSEITGALPATPLITHSAESKVSPEQDQKTLDFLVENTTGKTIYTTCFVYLRKDVYTSWRWTKSATYVINDNKTVTIKIPQVAEDTDRESTFGYLGIFDTKQAADDATYELTADKNKLDLDVLAKLKGKKVTLLTEKYGFKKPFIDFDFVDLQKKKQKKASELDFLVENNTNKTIYVCAFCYMKKAKGTWIAAVEGKDDMSNWRYDKTPILQLKHGETGYIDIDTIETNRDRENVIGFLSVFDEDEKDIAEKATYELLAPQNKIQLGRLKEIANQKIILEVEQYGIQGDLIDYAIKPTKKIDWKNVIGTPKK